MPRVGVLQCGHVEPWWGKPGYQFQAARGITMSTAQSRDQEMGRAIPVGERRC